MIHLRRLGVGPTFLFCLLTAAVVARATTVAEQAPPMSAQDRMAPGPGKDTTFKACGDCHAIDQALGLRRSRPEWIAMIDKMVSQGASIKDEDYDGILAYLSGNYGKPIRINDVTAADLRTLLDISAAEATAIVTYRTDKGKFASFDDLAKVPGINVTRITEEKQNFVFTSGS